MQIQISVDHWTPSGRQRSQPLYSAFVRNDFLGKECVIKGVDLESVQRRSEDKLSVWAAAEQKARQLEDAESDYQVALEAAVSQMEGLRSILRHTLSVDDQIHWENLESRHSYPPFEYSEPRPEAPQVPIPPTRIRKSGLEWLFRKKRARRLQREATNRERHKQCLQELVEEHKNARKAWAQRREVALKHHEFAKNNFEANQAKRNERLWDFRCRFERGESEAICEYLAQVFERSEYPDGFFIEHAVSYDVASRTSIVDVSLPPPDEISDIVDYKFIKATREARPIRLKEKDREQLYESVLHQVALRTIHEVFESDYTNHVVAVVVNGWVTALNRATGNDTTSCVFSIHADREPFQTINLDRVEPSECFRTLKGLVAGPLAQLAPVKPILHLNRDDDRFVESREILASINAHSNLAEISWQEFEHLVRDLFEKEFGREGAQVKVTQSSRDGGVDAVAFDPDPIRGGKFVIQAKRYLKNVPVSAVRDLYGTMIHEGAAKGILVTTSHYGRDARRFASDKPITLINGNELVFMLEQHGHKVRIDLDEAKAKRLAASAEAMSRASGDGK